MADGVDAAARRRRGAAALSDGMGLLAHAAGESGASSRWCVFDGYILYFGLSFPPVFLGGGWRRDSIGRARALNTVNPPYEYNHG